MRLSSESATAVIVAKLGRVQFTCRVDFTVCPGEPMVRYYADGSGYPGSPPSIDGIDYVECLECEWPTDGAGYFEYEDTGESWEYSDFEDRPGAKEIAERWIFADLVSGMYDDELMEDADYDG